MDGSRRWPEHLDAVIEEFQACFDAMARSTRAGASCCAEVPTPRSYRV